MRLSNRVTSAAADERGGILVFFALALPLLVLIVVAVADAGNWFEHRRHLQLQADAAALAGGTAYGYPCTAGINANIEEIARDYSGSHLKYFPPSPYDPNDPIYDDGSLAYWHNTAYNNQVGDESWETRKRMHVLLNSAIDNDARLGYWRDDNHPDRVDFSDTTADANGRPCESGFLDVKVTENDLPWLIPFGEFMGLDSLVGWIDARARIQIQKIQALGGPALLPLFVRDVSPKSAAAVFVDESNMSLIDVRYMTPRLLRDEEGNVTGHDCDSGLTCWMNDQAANVPISAGQQTSVVIALSSLPACSLPPTGEHCFATKETDPSFDTPHEICFQEGVECFWSDNASVRAGLLYVQGYSLDGGGSPPNKPALREVTLGPGLSGTPCTHGYFTFTNVDCRIHVRSEISMGGLSPDNASITAFGGKCGRNGCPLSYQAASGRWEGDIEIEAWRKTNANRFVPTNPIEFRWAYKNTSVDMDDDPSTAAVDCGNSLANSPCNGTFGIGHRSFSATDLFSGPIRAASLLDADAPLRNPYSYAAGSTASLFVGIKLAGAVAQCPSSATRPDGTALCDGPEDNDRPVQLASTQNQRAIDCDNGPQTDFRVELTKGCNPLYQILASDDPRWTQESGNPCKPPYEPASKLHQSPEPWDCVLTQNGTGLQGPFWQGIKGRILNRGIVCQGDCPDAPTLPDGTEVSCTAGTNDKEFVPGRNYWNGIDGWSSYLDERHAGDPRVVILFMVPFGAFRVEGQDIYPIVNFGAFYVTDWGGQGGNDDPCGIDGDIPEGFLSGHFINYVMPSNVGGGSGERCDPSAFTPCVPVLVE